MSFRTFLIGGGWDAAAAAAVYGPFLRAAADAAGGGAPRIGCVIVDEGDGAGQFARYEPVLRKVADCVPVPLLVPLGERFDVGLLRDVQGLLVCGGLTPAYQEVFSDCLDRLPGLLAEYGIPYAGFSAGAAVAARDALVGGWLDGGVAVCPEDSAEDLEEVEVRAGLGIVPFAVDVHAAQWGNLPRLIAAAARHGLAHGVALDENTMAEVTADGRVRVAGLGRAHSVRPGTDGGVLVRAYGDGEEFAAAG
ncbi:hypothetical protein ACH4ZX_06345 [Streptomyces sp. NPDC020490]|uniref:hypothetical protein n=1 Tax=Streptomyces sp. NPDC020490 TaxID=3365078 RepID=UPI00378DCEA4